MFALLAVFGWHAVEASTVATATAARAQDFQPPGLLEVVRSLRAGVFIAFPRNRSYMAALGSRRQAESRPRAVTLLAGVVRRHVVPAMPRLGERRCQRRPAESRWFRQLRSAIRCSR
ncbi:hypothetical protein C0036_15735 [Streptomyces sp. DJ]|nr:hypothetical protein C0036_15735 [Streptomyces sp. DJ]